MVNEERVKQLYKVAIYEQQEEKVHKQTGKYYRSDYIGKEMLKSIFTGTLAYFFMSVLVLVAKWDNFLGMLNHFDLIKAVLPMGLSYVVFMIVYMTVTYTFYKSRYENSRQHLEEYEEELRTLNQMYEREEKLKL